MTKFKANKFYHYAMKYIESPKPINENEIAGFDCTEMFNDELEQYIINKEHINININARVRKGKSTINLAIGKRIQDLVNKHKITEKRFGIKNIARTQYELNMMSKDPELNNMFIAIDEFNDLEETGQNARLS